MPLGKIRAVPPQSHVAAYRRAVDAVLARTPGRIPAEVLWELVRARRRCQVLAAGGKLDAALLAVAGAADHDLLPAVTAEVAAGLAVAVTRASDQVAAFAAGDAAGLALATILGTCDALLAAAAWCQHFGVAVAVPVPTPDGPLGAALDRHRADLWTMAATHPYETVADPAAWWWMVPPTGPPPGGRGATGR